MFPSKLEISRSNGRTRNGLSKRESPVQNGRVGMYGLLKDKVMEIIPKYGRTEAKVGLRTANRIIFEIASHFK